MSTVYTLDDAKSRLCRGGHYVLTHPLARLEVSVRGYREFAQSRHCLTWLQPELVGGRLAIHLTLARQRSMSTTLRHHRPCSRMSRVAATGGGLRSHDRPGLGAGTEFHWTVPDRFRGSPYVMPTLIPKQPIQSDGGRCRMVQ